ncbi:hypothetical protein ZIOFF_026442 [Zingiber officinale]|uniref:S-acyltransferase n=1 Tax=Zingiber officinale TaxID=94328 RepID=A0A8J5H466_ZINOF|nr:hypothetical protein ZIOFF_026442 [Zingiber officinale]
MVDLGRLLAPSLINFVRQPASPLARSGVIAEKANREEAAKDGEHGGAMGAGGSRSGDDAGGGLVPLRTLAHLPRHLRCEAWPHVPFRGKAARLGLANPLAARLSMPRHEVSILLRGCLLAMRPALLTMKLDLTRPLTVRPLSPCRQITASLQGCWLFQFIGGARKLAAGAFSIKAFESACMCYLQIFYLSIVCVTYFMFGRSSFRYIPGYYVSELHWYMGIVAVGVGVILFILTSFSDPGTVTADNVSKYLCPNADLLDLSIVVYAIGVLPDLITIAVGWHFIICIYGAFVLVLILAGQLKEHEIIYILTVYYGVEHSISSLSPHLVQWLLGSYNTQILLIVFLIILSLLLAGFFGYHAHLCLTNTTTNETFKWEDYISWKRKLNEAKASVAALKDSIQAVSGDAKPRESKWRAFLRKSPLQQEELVVKNNLYDQGKIGNICEIIFPLSERKSFLLKSE